jgi:hypothetical protein
VLIRTISNTTHYTESTLIISAKLICLVDVDIFLNVISNLKSLTYDKDRNSEIYTVKKYILPPIERREKLKTTVSLSSVTGTSRSECTVVHIEQGRGSWQLPTG